MRKAYLGRFTKGKMKGKPLVGKVFKDDVPGGAECHHDFDRAIIGKATEVVDRWNKREATKKIWVNGHKVARVTLGGRKVLMQVERKIPRFRKFNSNMGWIPPEDEPWVNETWWFEVAQVCRPVPKAGRTSPGICHRPPHRWAAPPRPGLAPPPPRPLRPRPARLRPS